MNGMHDERKPMNIIIANSSDLPIYEQITAQIKNLVMRGELAENELLPSIRSLARDLGISVITTKRAYEELERDGYIVSVPGKGSFVAAQNRELLREARIKVVEDKLSEAVQAAQTVGLTLDELQDMLRLFYAEE